MARARAPGAGFGAGAAGAGAGCGVPDGLRASSMSRAAASQRRKLTPASCANCWCAGHLDTHHAVGHTTRDQLIRVRVPSGAGAGAGAGTGPSVGSGSPPR